MPNNINFFDPYELIAIAEEVTPIPSFFRDRYFPTTESDIFENDKVLVEYRKRGRKMAALVAPRVGDIPLARGGYSAHAYEPAFVAPSRPLTLDDLKRRGFGESLHPNSTPAQRAARILLDDMTDLDASIARREELMCVQTMMNNACTMQEYVDANTVGGIFDVKFYNEDDSKHIFTVATPWNGTGGDFFGDVNAMCRALSERGLHAVDLVLGTDAAAAIKYIDTVQKLLDNRSMDYGSIAPQFTEYPDVALLGVLNFDGFKLNLLSVNESYEDENGKNKLYFPATSAMVTAPGCGHLMYAQITQINHGETEFTTYPKERVPKLIIDQPNDTRKLRLASRPLAAPKNYCPWMYAENVVG